MPKNKPLPLSPDLTLQDLAGVLSDIFDQAGIRTARLDARLLLENVAGLDHAEFILANNQKLSPQQVLLLDRLCQRRLAHEPIARIVGRAEFWSLPFEIGPAVLDPRPDTETLVSAALEVSQTGAEQACRILDLGTGSGCVLLSLLTERPFASGLGVDASLEALEIARRNAGHLGLLDRVTFLQSDWFETVTGLFDIIVSNPPYIAADEIAALAPDVKNYDPLLALSGGRDGLEAYRSILRRAHEFLKPEGWLLFECGVGQAGALSALMREALLSDLASGTDPRDEARCWQDLAGIKRVVGIRTATS